MRKPLLFSVVLSLFLLVPASIIRAQKISTQKGLTTAIFSTTNGDIKVHLPDDIHPGDKISGTVIAEAKGNNERQLDKNLSELLKYTVSIDGNKYAVSSKTIQWLVPADRSSASSIELLNAGGTKAGQVSLELKKPGTTPAVQGGCSIPSHALTGSPFSIPGNFDGDLNNTQCRIGDKSAEIIAESQRQTIVIMPENAKGPQRTEVKENGEDKCARQISGVDLEVVTGKLNLVKGENTYIDVKVTGLQNLPDTAVLTITNMTPGVVTMTNGNLQVITIWPPSDTAHGTFSLHCPAVSITGGNFTVDINLDLPQAGTTTTTPSELPPGYTRKSCECSATATVTKTGNTFKAEGKGECKGVYGVGINTFTRCEVQSISYAWFISNGKENAEIAGRNNTASVNVVPKNNGNYIVCATVTVICSDGTVCLVIVCTDQSGRNVPPGTVPGDPTTPADPKNPPTTPRDPEKNPPTTTSSRCSCGCTVRISETASDRKEPGFTAVVTPACSGTFGTGNTRSVCAVASIVYAWSITAGGEFAKITGGANGAGVKVSREKPTPFTLRVDVTVTCNDGSTCTCYDILMVPGIEEKSCSPAVSEKMEPAMDGGLKSKQIGLANSPMMPRDEFIALQAEGGDWDQLVFRCVPGKPDCKDDPSEKIIPLAGRVRFEWAIEGEGSFVKLGCIPDDKNADGDRVIFKPPYVALPVKAADTTIVTIIKLKIIDDGSAVTDETKEKIITIRTKRSKAAPDKYSIDIAGGTGTAPGSPAGKNDQRTCRTEGPVWMPGDDLATPVIQKPAVTDNDKMVLGQWLVLSTASQGDNDKARFTCTSANKCPVGTTEKNYPDKVEWTWEIIKGGGKFITGNTGRVVIYEAPTEMTENVREVVIKVTVKNPGGERKDPDKMQQELVIKVYKPGVRLSHPGLGWLPEEDNSLELKSELMYKDGDWKPALAHMCRIHYFELLNVSEEKGVCLNTPVPKDADQCRDMQMKNEGGHEAFDDSKGAGKCTVKEIYQQARTKQPEKVYSITVHSRDFGAYGFLRSFANISKKGTLEGKPVYVSIPVKRTDVIHPLGRVKRTEYQDNRVTIPHDIDENKIADNGWMTTGGVMRPDPANNNEDEDDQPSGDLFNGDGLSSYEEYRGFKITEAKAVVHTRTHDKVKDIFIRNEKELKLDTYFSASGLDVHEISENQYVDDRTRVINPNFNAATHIVNQMGLRLVDRGSHSSLLGIAVSTTSNPAIPNQEVEIRIYSKKIAESCERRGLENKVQEKIKAVTAHELLHGNNVCHHGEGNPESENSFDLKQGLRSGNTSCVMRYDNVGTALRDHSPETIGSSLCDSAAGTGYNANGAFFGNAAAKRGNCKGQIRVSGKGNPPKTCGNR